jgi:CHAD domain-containing protein
MSYRLQDQETVPDSVRRVVLEQLDKALDQTKAASRNQDEAIHDARVCLKKVRAVLRLVQATVDANLFRRENACYRDASRRLSAVRDSAAILEMFDKLTDRFAAQLAADVFLELRQSLSQSTTARRTEKRQALAAVGRTLTAARRRVERWPIPEDGFSALRLGLKDTYRRGRRSFVTAFEQPSVENFHAWRKEVKYLWYQLRLLKPIWPPMMRTLADELKTLGDRLSDDHDLAVLRQRVLDQAEKLGDRTTLEALIALIDQRRGELQVEAKHLGERLYAEKPQTFVGRLQAYWQAWGVEADVDPIAVG